MSTVLVVDDSAFMRTVIANALTDAGYDVEVATDGREAVAQVEAVEPDVVTMDVEMPELSGIEAVERIMRTNPTAIVMLSAYTERGADATLDALERGAVDFIHKPDGSDSRNIAHLVDAVVETVDEVTAADVSSLALSRAAAAVHATNRRVAEEHPTPRVETTGSVVGGGDATVRAAAVATDAESAGRPYLEHPTVVVGASTGGPKILEYLLDRLPLELDAKVLVVQHMPGGFTERFAARLDRISDYDVREAADGDRVVGGEAVVAPGGYHLVVRNNVAGGLRIDLTEGERVHGVRPSIDVTMESAANHVTDPLVGLVLTGMGKDGGAGIEAIHAAGGRTIAQDEATSPVHGIPATAIATGCVDEIVAAPDLADHVCAAFRTDGETDD